MVTGSITAPRSSLFNALEIGAWHQFPIWQANGAGFLDGRQGLDF
jgi:hypothetical protein